ncbi:BON1-associated protein 2-like [Lathyrus oleraceus]|uniref:BON1-associated protein 2-like n=1 Tax=Pisum sativum TaxID=3888 RepID=UPI001FC50B05|nr:BON1-associated protein 2-like [Pisum sativum]
MGVNVISRTLEITVISCENIHVSDDAYVVVRGESLNCYTTKTVKDKSSFLSWDEKFLLDMPLHARSITFEVQSKKFKGARPIGIARIAVADFLNGDESENCMRVLRYRLRDWEGKKNGVIHFGVKVVVPEKISVTAVGNETLVNGKNFGDRLTGVDCGGKNSNGVVWGNYTSSVI